MLPWRESEFVVPNSASYIHMYHQKHELGRPGGGGGVVGCGVF